MAPVRQVTYRQLELLIDFAEEYPSITLGYRISGEHLDHKEANKAWEQCTQRLNAVEGGLTKPWEKWKRYWHMFKCRTKSKAADNRRNHEDNGGAPSKLCPLTDLEERLVAIMGKMAVEGIQKFGQKEITTKIKNINQHLQEKTEGGAESTYAPKLQWNHSIDSFLRKTEFHTTSINLIPSDGENSDNTLRDTNSDHETMDNDGTQALIKLEQDSSSEDTCETITENIPRKNVSTKKKLYYLDSETNNLKMVSDIGEAISNRAKNVTKLYENFKTLPEDPNATIAPPRDGAFAEGDEYTTFGNHVANQLRKLSSVHYVLAQEEIQSVLTKFRMLDLNE